MIRNLLPVASFIILFIAGQSLAAQDKAHIHIRKNSNGKISEENREIMLEEGQKIDDILREMGLLDELGQLKTGQELEIRIDKSGGNDELQSLEFLMSPEGTDMLSLPDFAPAPPTENRPFLGVMLRQINNQDSSSNGVYVTEVVEGSAAEAAGLKAGDVITKIEDNEVDDIDDVISFVQSKKKGDKIEIIALRDGKKKKFKAVLGEKAMSPSMMPRFPNTPEAPGYNFRFGPDSITIYCPQIPNCILPNDSMKICQPFSWDGSGLAVKETAFLGVTPTGSEETEGVKVNVEGQTAAEEMGLISGDVILEVNELKVNSFNDLADAISKMNPGDEIRLLISRDGKKKNISGPLGKRSVSGFDDFRIFHDFKGMDEGGNYFYDYEFDMDEEDVEERMEQLLQELDRQQQNIEDERDRIESELDKLNSQKETIIIQIQIAEISTEEAARVNANASPKLETNNNLSLEQISFFPNPGVGILNLNFSTTESKPVKILLYNSEGALVYLEERSSFDGSYKNTIDISNEPNGTYYLQIMQDGKTYSKKIVKGR